MKIAIPQYEGTVSQAYELSQNVSLHQLDFQESRSADQGLYAFPGAEASIEWMSEQGVQAILVGTIDPENAEQLADAGIHVFTGADDLSPADNVDRFITLMREALSRKPAGGCCGGHGACDEEEGSGCCGGSDASDDHECCGGAGHDDPDHVCKCH